MMTFEEKKEQALWNVDEAIENLKNVADKLSDVLDRIEEAENANELWDALTDGDLEECVGTIDNISDLVNYAFDSADDELEDMAHEDEEDEEE